MTEHLCIVCPTRGRDIPDLYETANVCASCRAWLAGLPVDIHRLWTQLGDQETLADRRQYEVTVPFIGPLLPAKVRPLVRTGELRWMDPVGAALPTMANGVRIGGDQVSGSREARLPINEDMVDLGLPARQGSRAPFARGVLGLDDCQVGHLSTATILDTVVRTWIGEPWCRADRLPVPTVPALAQWLSRWMAAACDHHLAIDEDVQDLRELRATLRGVLGEAEPRPERMGAPCPGCDMLTLIRQPGEDRVECAGVDCARVLTAEEYVRWGGMVLADVRERMAA